MLAAIEMGTMGRTAKAKSPVDAGFTLVELMITLVIAAVLATIAAPSFRDYMASQRIKDGAFDLMAAIIFARSEAIKRNASVDVIPASAATPKNWASGWTVSVGGTTLRKQDAKSGLSITDSAALAKLTYGNDGRVTTSTAFLVDLTSSLSGVNPRCVTISPSGAPSSKSGGC